MEWTAFDEAPQGVKWLTFVSLFGKVLGPIVQFALTLSLETRGLRWRTRTLESDRRLRVGENIHPDGRRRVAPTRGPCRVFTTGARRPG